MSELLGMVGMIRPGMRVHLGHLQGGGYGLWLAAGGQPVDTFPPGEAGWVHAVDRWTAWENPPSPQRSAAGAIYTLVVLVVLVGLYLAAHAYVYRGCTIAPSAFSWPGRCYSL